MENKEYRVSEKFLDDAIEKVSKTLVGKVMKRFEIFDNKEDIKKSVKELIYENYRVFKEIIKSFSTGIKFVTKPREKE